MKRNILEFLDFIIMPLGFAFLLWYCIKKDNQIKELKANPIHDTVYVSIPDYIQEVDTFVLVPTLKQYKLIKRK